MVVLGEGAVSYKRGNPIMLDVILSMATRARTLQPQGHLAHKKHPLPLDHHRSLGIGLLQGPTRGVFLMSEVPMYKL